MPPTMPDDEAHHLRHPAPSPSDKARPSVALPEGPILNIEGGSAGQATYSVVEGWKHP
jgi:hypothetical protein